jgi:hypothetical protein
MKRLYSLLLAALCLLAACDPSPPPSPTGGVQLETSSLRADPLTGNNTAFNPQKVCDSSAEQLITVHNEEASARQISFAEATAPFVLTAIQDASGRKELPFAPITLNPDKRVSFFVKFSPRTPGEFNGYLNVYSDAPSSPYKIPLSGKSTGPRLELSSSSLTLSPSTATSDAGVSDDGGTSLSSSAIGTVRLTNSGNAPLTSLTLSPVASPFSAKLSRAVTTSEPLQIGGTVDLVVTFDPPATSNAPFFQDTLIVTSDDPCAPTSRIPLTGFRTAGPVVTPTVLTFAEQEVGMSSAPQSVKVLNGGGSVLTVDSLSLQGDSDAGTPFVVSPSGAFSLAPGESRDLSVKFNPSTEGHQTATLRLASSGGSFPPISLSGDAVQVPALVVEKTFIEFPTQAPGQSRTQTVSVSNPGSSPLSVNAAVTSTDKTLTLEVEPVSFTLDAKATQTLVVTMTPSSSAVAGPLSGQLTLSSEVSRSSRQTLIPIVGKIERAKVTPLPTLLSFDNQLVGATPQRLKFALRNTTTLPVTVYDVPEGSLGPYSVEGLPVTIPGGEDRSVEVFFNPTSRKDWDVDLKLDSDAPDAIATVKLSGKAIAPVLSVDSASLNLDFGSQVPGTRVSKTVKLTNTGDADVLVSRIAPMVDSTPFSVESLNPPQTVTKEGGSISFEVVFNPNDLGKKETTLLFYVDNSSTALDSPRLKLFGTSSSPIGSLSPSDTVDFGYRRVDDSSAASMKVTLANDKSATEPLEIVGVTIEDKTVGFSIAGTHAGELVNAGSTRDIWVNFKPSSMNQDTYSDKLVVTYRGSTTKVSRPLAVPLVGKVATAVMSVVDKLPFGAVELTRSKPLQLVITNKGNSILHLKTIEIRGEETDAKSFLLGPLDWPKDIGAGKQETISIDFKPATTQAAVSAQLVITSNATGGNVDTTTGKTMVTLSGQGGVARAVFGQRAIGFGEVPVGQTSTIGLLVTNTGSLPLLISRPTPSASFSVQLPATTGWPVSIPAQESFTFPIVFAPTSASASPVSENLTFTSNDRDDSSVSISLQGLGTQPMLKVSSSVEFGAPVPAEGGVGYKEIARSLPLQNDGKAPLVITSLSITFPFCIFIPSSNTCVETLSGAPLLALVPAIPWTEQKSIELRVKPTSAGRTEGSLTITTNAGVGATSHVTLVVGQKGVSVPSDPLEFGTCPMDELPTSKQERSINVSNTGIAADSITQVSFAGPDGSDFSIVNPPSSSSPLPVPSGGLATLNLRFKPGKGAAGLRTAVALIYTEAKGTTPLVLPLKGVATGEFSGFKDFQWEVKFHTQRLSEKKDPERFSLRNQLDRPIYVKTYKLEGQQKDDFQIEVDERCHLTNSQIEIRVGETCDLLLSYVARQVSISHAYLVLEAWTRAGDDLIPTTRVKLSGEMVSSILSVDPMEVDFGWVDKGQAIEPRLITVTNRSSVATRVLVPEVSHPEFFEVEALEPGKELPPAGTTQLRVTFHPGAGGEITGDIRLRLQGEQETDVTIGLRGQVLALEAEGGGHSCAASGGGPLLAGWLLLMALGARRRSHRPSP